MRTQPNNNNNKKNCFVRYLNEYSSIFWLLELHPVHFDVRSDAL